MTKISKIIKGVPSSFVFKNMKLDTDKGAGEAKLFVGSISQIEDINDFFKFDQEYSYRFDKSNLLNYLHEVKMEYVFQHVNKYKEASIETLRKHLTEEKILYSPDAAYRWIDDNKACWTYRQHTG